MIDEVESGMVVMAALGLVGCTSQFAFGPAAWSTVPPVIPGLLPCRCLEAGLLKSRLLPITPPAATPEQTTLGALQEAQATREAVRKLAR